MRKIVILLAFVMASVWGIAQITVPGTNVTFDFPNKGWKFLQTTNVDKNTAVYLYSYSAKNVVDAEGDTIIPFMRIYVKKDYDESVYDLAYGRWMKQPFEAIEEYMDGLPTDKGVGYVGAYTDLNDKKDYMFRMIYFKDRTNILEVRLESTLDTYKEMEPEFLSILSTFKVNTK